MYLVVFLKVLHRDSNKSREHILGKQSNIEPAINECTNNFTIVLASTDVEQPGKMNV